MGDWEKKQDPLVDYGMFFIPWEGPTQTACVQSAQRCSQFLFVICDGG